MVHKTLVTGLVFASCVLVAGAADKATTDKTAAPTNVTAAQVVERNVSARGGLQAWRGVQALQETGTMGAGGNERAAAPVEVPGAKRPGKSMPMPSSPG